MAKHIVYIFFILLFIGQVNAKLNNIIDLLTKNNITAERNFSKNSFDLHTLSENSKEKPIPKIKENIHFDKSIKITFYAPKLRGINSDKNPNRTALMKKPISGWTCAISRDLMELGWLGKKIYIDGIGIRYASDLMAKTYKGKKITKQIDLCVGKKDVFGLSKKLGKNIRFVCLVD